MLDFIFPDFELLFPNINETLAQILRGAVNVFDMSMYILLFVAEWKLFKKFGEKPWKSLIPFYNVYLLYKHTWKGWAAWIYLFSGILYAWIFSLSETIAEIYPESLWVSVLLFVSLFFGVVETVTKICSAIRIAETFNKGLLFGIGLVFLYTIFITVLAFGKAEYRKNLENTEESEELANALGAEPEKETV